MPTLRHLCVLLFLAAFVLSALAAGLPDLNAADEGSPAAGWVERPLAEGAGIASD